MPQRLFQAIIPVPLPHTAVAVHQRGRVPRPVLGVFGGGDLRDVDGDGFIDGKYIVNNDEIG